MTATAPNAASSKQRLSAVPLLKFMLILGVVMIHCTVRTSYAPGESAAGYNVVQFMVSLARVSVPAFFIISGYLFFYQFDNFNFTLYKDKLRSRYRTLFVPYVVWNIILYCEFLFKVYVLGYPSYGIIDGDTVNRWKMLEGFVYIEQAQGLPYAFAFWFIRNLMVFIILSPLVWLVARKWWIAVAVLFLQHVFYIRLYFMEWFIIGATLSLNGFNPEKIRIRNWVAAALGIITLLTALARFNISMPGGADKFLFCVEVMAATAFLYYLSLRISRTHDGPLLQTATSSTFFIYAFHQCFCFLCVKIWASIFGYATLASCMTIFFCAFFTTSGISFAMYLLLKEFSPRLLNLLTR